ncbi:MAG TPA: hypothetical protein VK076_07545 [Candidatus Sphingobacterium stercoripullorum]|nr:hypothetical protein [Candidatus Sphingobacterium stercoripullorum]
MALPTAIKQIACERLFHFHPVKTIARELGISAGAIQAWRIFIKANDFEWLTSGYVQSRKPRIYQAVKDWIAHYPIGYTELARRHGVRPSDVYREIQAYLKQSPSAKLPLRLHAWKLIGPGANREKMNNMPERIRRMVDECFESANNEQELKRNIKEMFISYESLFEEVMKECKDDLKKKELQQYLDQLNCALELTCE